MFQQLKHKFGNNLINIQGWRTSRKIMVLESDDWGTIRMPNPETRKYLTSKYPKQTWGNTYDRVDNLANADDLSALYEILLQYTDKNGRHPIITANTIVANPDFEKIKAVDYTQYFFEPFTETLKRYPSHAGTFKLWEDGIRAGVFKPQLHGREHLNVCEWLTALQADRTGIRDAFNHGTWLGVLPDGRRLDVAFDYENAIQLEVIARALNDASTLFGQLFGFRSSSYIAPSYTWSDDIEKTLKKIGINTIQSGLFQVPPRADRSGKKRRHYIGQDNGDGQIYLMRNLHFEPALAPNENWVGKCMSGINRIFRWQKPVILSSHRLNYIGNLDEKNRTDTLHILKDLLGQIIQKYPDIEFMTSDELGQTILASRQV